MVRHGGQRRLTTSAWLPKKIFAEPGTLTGSIGVVGGKLVIGGLFNTIGLKTEIIARGPTPTSCPRPRLQRRRASGDDDAYARRLRSVPRQSDP